MYISAFLFCIVSFVWALASSCMTLSSVHLVSQCCAVQSAPLSSQADPVLPRGIICEPSLGVSTSAKSWWQALATESGESPKSKRVLSLCASCMQDTKPETVHGQCFTNCSESGITVSELRKSRHPSAFRCLFPSSTADSALRGSGSFCSE